MQYCNYISLPVDDENDGISNIVKQKIDIEKQRTKLLQFSENRRPPYWGTWRKQSRSINSRKPFAMDMVSLEIICIYEE